jgi:hypothetical protein
VVAWKNGHFKFKNMPAQQIIPEIVRCYDVELAY